jgi:hypothetical protein
VQGPRGTRPVRCVRRAGRRLRGPASRCGDSGMGRPLPVSLCSHRQARRQRGRPACHPSTGRHSKHRSARCLQSRRGGRTEQCRYQLQLAATWWRPACHHSRCRRRRWLGKGQLPTRLQAGRKGLVVDSLCRRYRGAAGRQGWAAGGWAAAPAGGQAGGRRQRQRQRLIVLCTCGWRRDRVGPGWMDSCHARFRIRSAAACCAAGRGRGRES